VIYQALGEEIVIVAVAHLHRKPGHWRERIWSASHFRAGALHQP
jgi:hypothetical protein